MNSNSLLVLSAVAMLAAGAAQADAPAAPSQAAAVPVADQAVDARSHAVYQGTDAQGRIVQLTIADIGVPTLVRIAPRAAHYPEASWSSQIGTGRAAALEH